MKYRMIYDNGYIETLDLAEAEAYGNYVVIYEEVPDPDPAP